MEDNQNDRPLDPSASAPPAFDGPGTADTAAAADTTSTAGGRPAPRARDRFIDDYIAYLLARASHLVSRRFHEALALKGIPVPDWRVLASLSDGDGVSLGTLAQVTLFKQPTLTKIIDRMEADGTVRRTPSTRDRRKVLITITEKGRALVAQLLRDAKRQERDVLADYSPEQRALLKSTLRDLIDRLDPA